MEQNEGHMTESVSESTPQNLVEHPVAIEKQVSQSVVNRIVGESKKEAFEQGVRAGQASISPQIPTPGVEAQRPDHVSASAEQIKAIVQEQLDSRVQAERDREMNVAAQQFLIKLKPGEAKYPDFNQVINSVNWNAIPYVLDLANQLTENTDDVIYELAKNPQKAINLWQLSQVNPQAAIAETNKLADSIKQNQRQPNSPRPPLSPLTPSVTKTDNGIPSTVGELRQQPWLQG